jgi:hypothetical protein
LCLAVLTGSLRVRADEAPSSPAPAPPAQPDATIHISAKSLSAGLGYSWGKGTLEYQGKTYPVSMDGLLVLAVGFSSVDATGRVYNLKSLDDFDGKYAGVRGGGAIGEGGAGVAMQNEKGVEVRMVTDQTGVTLTLGASGVKLAVEK